MEQLVLVLVVADQQGRSSPVNKATKMSLLTTIRQSHFTSIFIPELERARADDIWGRRRAAASGNAGIFFPRGFCGCGGRQDKLDICRVRAPIGAVPKASIVLWVP